MIVVTYVLIVVFLEHSQHWQCITLNSLRAMSISTMQIAVFGQVIQSYQRQVQYEIFKIKLLNFLANLSLSFIRIKTYLSIKIIVKAIGKGKETQHPKGFLYITAKTSKKFLNKQKHQSDANFNVWSYCLYILKISKNLT